MWHLGFYATSNRHLVYWFIYSVAKVSKESSNMPTYKPWDALEILRRWWGRMIRIAPKSNSASKQIAEIVIPHVAVAPNEPASY